MNGKGHAIGTSGDFNGFDLELHYLTLHDNPQALLSHRLYSILHSVFLSPPQDTRSYWHNALLSAANAGDEGICNLLTQRQYWQVWC